jgi:hypothetical protein
MLLDEYLRVEGRKTRFETIGEIQVVLDDTIPSGPITDAA